MMTSSAIAIAKEKNDHTDSKKRVTRMSPATNKKAKKFS